MKLQVEEATALEKEKGRLLLDQWNTIVTAETKDLPAMTMQVTDRWVAFFPRVFNMPWPESPLDLRLEISPLNQEVHYLDDGQKQVISSQYFSLDKNKDVMFWLRLVYSFMVPPYRLLGGKTIAYAGDAAADGKSYYLVFISGGESKPSAKYDQYLVWLNQQDGRPEFIQYTLRELKPFLYGTMHLADYRQVGKYLLPHRLAVVDYPGSDYVVRETLVKEITLSQK